MSIASEIQRLYNIKALIRTALVNKGITSASTHDMEDFPDDIDDIQTGGTYQSKTVSPTTSQQTVSPDSGYDALSNVTVNAIQTQTKSATPTTSAQTITPDSGKYLTSVSISAATKQSKTVSPSTSSQTVTPDSGYYGLSQVTVNAMNLQNKSASITVPFSRSFTTTPVTISPDNGYDGMETTSVTMPQLVEYQLISYVWIRPVHQVYDDTTRIYFEEAETICGIYLSRSGWSSKSNIYAIRANPAFGDATPADVRSGKTFTSGSGFALVGTGNF